MAVDRLLSAGSGSATDEKAKVSSNDTTQGYLNGKLVQGANITLTENTDGGNETLTIAATGGAPTSAAFLTATAEAGLSAEVNFGALTTGMLKHTVAGGVSTPATATEGTDYYKPGGTDVAVVDGGTGSSTAAGARTGLGVDYDTTLPWLINIDCFHGKISSVGTWANAKDDGSMLNGSNYNTTLALNDEANYDVVLAAGTWTFSILGLTNTNAAIITVKFDGTTVGTIDQYSGSIVYNVVATITGIVVGTTAKIRIKLLAATKNASSSAYAIYQGSIQLRRTA